MTAESVAADIERAFPELDNHLINYLQFARSRNGNRFVTEYLAHEAPKWSSIDIADMQNRREYRKRGAVLGGTVLLLLLPLGFAAAPWATAVLRVVNPFANIAPVTLTRLVDVSPGDAVVSQGSPLTITSTIAGYAGHSVRVDVLPSDDKKTAYNIGTLNGNGTETFTHRLPKVASTLKYRVRAGDAPPSEWFNVATRPVPALTKLDFEVKPMTYTRAAPRSFDGLSEDVEALEGSEVTLTLSGNQPLSAATLRPGSGKRIDLVSDDNGLTWTGLFTASKDMTLTYKARNRHGEPLEGTVGFKVHADRAPAITVTRPVERTLLRQGMVPHVSFVVDDDYGLADVRIERIDIPGDGDTGGTAVKTWNPTGTRVIEESWSGGRVRLRNADALVYRVVATDSSPLGQRIARSPLITFDLGTDPALLDAERKKQARNARSLKDIIDLQALNLEATRELAELPGSTKRDQWDATAVRQEEIRRLARSVLTNPAKILGSLTPVMKQLYNKEMLDVIGELRRVPTQEGQAQQRTADRTVALEEAILRQLTRADRAVAATDKRRQVAEILGALEALIDGETDIVKITEKVINRAREVDASVVERQDDLAFDVSVFVSTCRERASALEANNAKFAELVLEVAATCESTKIKTDMLRAAEMLDDNQPTAALAHERTALNKLTDLEKLLKQWQVSEAETNLDEILDALSDARDKIEKIRKLQEKLIATVDQIRPNLNKGTEEADLFEEEVDEMQERLKEAASEIPTDLHIFSEMNVANELVEDIATVFESVDQKDGSATDTNRIEEVGHLKPEDFIEMMKDAEERLDALEMWLTDEPEPFDFNNEAFDQEEMGPMAMTELPTSLEDIIGDLLEESEKISDESEDSASNQGVPDLEAGWDIMEGPTVSHSAQGKSGNQRPDHKEQDGRSLVGRQGMSSGETAAGGGTIEEGDTNIDERRTTDPTQSGHVQVDGDADENATGGGKQGSGSADDYGMSGQGGDQRMDSTGPGSWEGLEDLMAKTEAVHIKASLLNLRTESLGAAAHHMKQARDAIARGLPIEAVREHHRRAIQALRDAQTELDAGVTVGITASNSGNSEDDATVGTSDEAPDEYRDLVADYFRSLSEPL